MPNESGDLKLLANLRKLIDPVPAFSDCKPRWSRAANLAQL
jgi:hypothetical protein